MKRSALLLVLFVLTALSGIAQVLTSPNGHFKMTFSITKAGAPAYMLSYKDKPVIKESTMGLLLKDQRQKIGEGTDADMQQKSVNLQSSLYDNFRITDSARSTHDEYWDPVWGEVKTIRNHYNELAVTLTQQGTERIMRIRFRMFDDGLGFRYEFPEQKNLIYFVIK